MVCVEPSRPVSPSGSAGRRVRILTVGCCVAGLALAGACQPPATETASTTTTMENQTLTLHVGETQAVELTSRGASGMQLLFTTAPEGIVAVSRRDISPQEREKMAPSIGGGTPAYFSLTGSRAGQATVSFYEKPAGGRDGPEIPVATYQVTVTE